MAADYYVVVKDQSNNVLAVITDFLELSYKKDVWEAGMCDLKLEGSHPAIQYFADNNNIEIWRYNKFFGVAPYIDYYGICRGYKRSTPKMDYFNAIIPDQLSKLGWRIVAYRKAEPNRSLFAATPAETIMKNLVKYNCTSLGTVADGRAILNPIPGISVETDLGRGNVIDWKSGWTNLLTELIAIAKVAGGDYALVNNVFKFFPGQLGTDRSSTTVFSLNLDNMQNPNYAFDKSKNATIAIVGGSNQADDRAYLTVTGNDYDVNSNNIEHFVDARNNDTVALMTSKANKALYAAKARQQLTLDVLQTANTVYGRDYFLGDLVKVYYKNITSTQKVQSVSITYKKGTTEETIKITTRDMAV